MKIFISRIANKISGAEIYILNQLAELRRYKDIEIVCSFDQKELVERTKELGVKTILTQSGISEIATKKQLIAGLPKLPSYFKKYNQIFKTQKSIDVFIFHSMTEKILLSPILLSQNRKVIWVEHGPIFAAEWFIFIKKWYKLLSRFVTKIITISEDTKHDLISHGIAKEKIVVIPSGVDTKKFFPPIKVQKDLAKRKIGLENKFIVGFAGTITKEKGMEEILEAAKFSDRNNLKIDFLVTGSGPDINWIKESAKTSKVKNIHLVGFQQNVKQFYTAMDVFLFPTHHLEGISLALIEAAAMGIPIIASDKGGNREVITPVTGILYKKFSLAQCIGVLEKIKNDRKYFSELTKNARNLVENKYSIAITTKTFYNLLHMI